MLSHSLNQSSDIEIRINNKTHQVKDTKFFEKILDTKLNWQPQFHEVNIKISKISRIIYMEKEFVQL